MNVYKFYNNSGWKKRKSIFEDAKLFEDLRLYSKEYVSKCRKRILNYIPKEGKEILDFASGPIQYKEYLKYSNNFKYRHCVDFSKTAIKIAKRKIKKRGKYYNKDFMKIKFKEPFLNIGTGKDFSINWYAKFVMKKMKIKLKIFFKI